jgi:hypothetical protein
MIARRMLAYALTVAIAAAPAAAQTISMTPELAKVVADAKAEGKLSLRSAVAAFGGPEGAQRVGDAINKTFGTNLTVEWSPGRLVPLMGRWQRSSIRSSTRVSRPRRMFTRLRQFRSPAISTKVSSAESIGMHSCRNA